MWKKIRVIVNFGNWNQTLLFLVGKISAIKNLKLSQYTLNYMWTDIFNVKSINLLENNEKKLLGVPLKNSNFIKTFSP